MPGPHFNKLDYRGRQQDNFPGGDLQLSEFGLENFPEEEERQEEVEDNFLVTEPGRGGENDETDTFADLLFPVVDPAGDLDPSNDKLSKAALDDADSLDGRADIPEEMQDELDDRIDSLKQSF